MKTSIVIFSMLFVLFSCAQESDKIAVDPIDTIHTKSQVLIDTSGMTIQSRFNPESGYQRISYSDSSFDTYLRMLKLKPSDTQVRYYNGNYKPNYNVYCGVVDLPIGNKDLHQCADAIMRLRAEYLWEQKRFNEIHFNFTNGFRAEYSKWISGYKIAVSGNSVSWVSGGSTSTGYDNFWAYMERVFNYAGTLSLSKELKPVALSEMQIGDVFILGGSPGHAVIVIDMIEDTSSGKKKFMLAQSYMPAQEIQILINPKSVTGSPWYDLDFGSVLITPEWTFKSSDLKRFE